MLAFTMVLNNGLSTCSSFTFVAGMISRRTNAKGFSLFHFFHDLFVGILAGYVAGTIPVCLSVVGLLFIPRHASFLNQTTKSIATCASNISTTEGETSKSLFLTHILT